MNERRLRAVVPICAAASASALTLAVGCATVPAPPPRGEPTMDSILRSHPGLREVLDDPEAYRFQAVLGVVEPGPGGRPTLRQDGFRLGSEYFYPASTVKLFAAVAALERLAALREATGLPIDADTPLVYHPLLDGDEREDRDLENRDGGTLTVRQEIRKIFLVSDNRAFNRLYELVGQDGLARSLRRAGVETARIVHRLAEPRSEEENRRFPRIDLVTRAGTHTLPERTVAPLPVTEPPTGLAVGRAHWSGGELVEEPMDFRSKNHVPLAELQRGLCMVVQPEVDCAGAGFDLSPDARQLLLDAMRAFPRESANPAYAADEYPDAYVKFVLPGVRRFAPEARVYDKTGLAYGFATENAWIVDEVSGRSFFLAATLYTNPNQVLNDDDYAYQEVALPFLADLGEAAVRTLLGGS